MDAEQRVARRRAAVPAITYPPQLPVSQRKDDIAEAIRESQVVIVAGETGSERRRSSRRSASSWVAVYAAPSVTRTATDCSERLLIASPRAHTSVGDVVGFKVRFTDRSSDDTLIKVMTDGILLAEIQRDRELLAYDTIIIDEAHERSLNIDFLLGYLKQLLPRRPDLKVIITSATIDPDRFSRHFDDAPVIEVSGRMFPVEVRYRPIVDDDADDDSGEPRDQTRAICDAIAELSRAGPGDVLVFLSGEREIRDTADALRKQQLRDTRSAAVRAFVVGEQHRVFQPHRGRRIILATNVRNQPDRSRHPVRRRSGNGTHLAVQLAAEGAAPAHRSNQSGERQPANRTLRTPRGRRVHPSLLRGGLRRTAGVHRSRDSAHEPRISSPR